MRQLFFDPYFITVLVIWIFLGIHAQRLANRYYRYQWGSYTPRFDRWIFAIIAGPFAVYIILMIVYEDNSRDHE